MSTGPGVNRCDRLELVSTYALGALPASEARTLEAHLAECGQCRQELESVRRILNSFSAWPVDVLSPPTMIWDRLVERIGLQTGGAEVAPRSWVEPDWEDVAPGISCKLLATSREKDRVTMLVRLAPGAEYPPHTHAGVEELHLLNGELWIEDRKLLPGDYNRAEPGTTDKRVWSETGCTCVLITSPSDLLS